MTHIEGTRPGMVRLRLFTAILSLMLLVPWTTAADESLFVHTYDVLFVGFGGALGLSNFDEYDAGDPSGGVTLRVGGRPFEPFAWEVEGDYFIKFAEGEVSPLLVTANVRWMPRNPAKQWQPFLLAGSGWMQARQDEDGKFDALDSGVFRLGAGVEMIRSLDLAVRLDAQYLLPVGDANEFQFAALLLTIQIY
ncbi:MAG: hypothetical protein JRF61_01785 [Deltaproteobacteria bacterium]|jgi:hypothetical protein|nr:hypothetical protein [Deltaproteobacteria bacterium]